MKNQRGFAALGAVLTVIVLAAIGGAGYYVYKQNQDKQTRQSTQIEENGPQKNESTEPFTYILPEGWSEMSCGEKNSETNPEYKLAFPNGDSATDCDNRENVAYISVLTDESRYEGYDKCQSLDEAQKDREAKSGKASVYKSYICSETTINGSRVLTIESEDVASPGFEDYVGYKYQYRLAYAFVDDVLLNISYTNSTKDQSRKAEIDQLSKSVKFN